MIHLAEKDPNGTFLPKDTRTKAEVISWLMFQMVSFQTASLHAILHDILSCFCMCTCVRGECHCHSETNNVLHMNDPVLHLHKTLMTQQTFPAFSIFRYSTQQISIKVPAHHCLLVNQGGIGPMQGQANHFVRYAPEKIEYGMKRYTNETKRLYGVIEQHLASGKEWLAADQYTIADMANYAWIAWHDWAGNFPL